MKNLRLLRKEKGMSLKELASYFGTSPQVFSRYEREEHQPDFETIIKIADFFDVSIDYLLGRNFIDKSKKGIIGSPSAEDKTILDMFHKLNENEKTLILSWLQSIVREKVKV